MNEEQKEQEEVPAWFAVKEYHWRGMMCRET